jgi:peptide/nickel transport system ATP-binding protein
MDGLGDDRPVPDAVLRLIDLNVSIVSAGIEVSAVRHVSLSLARGEIVGLVGRSGAGKSALAYAVMRLGGSAMRVAGSVLLDDKDLLALPEHQMRSSRGGEIALVVSNPHAALDPLASVSAQIMRVYRTHHPKVDRKTAAAAVLDMVKSVGIPDAERRLGALPDQLSGGMAQRIVIAMSLISSPKVVIADEPTFGLDVTIQAQVLSLMRRLCTDRGAGTLLITRDLGIVAQFCDRVVVMDEGAVVEEATVGDFFARPQHPASQRLLASSSRPLHGSRLRALVSSPAAAVEGERVIGLDDHTKRAPSDPSDLLVLDHVVKEFPIGKGLVVHAVNDVSLRVRRGETLGLVGESGSGKTTIGRLILGLERPTRGEITFDGAATAKLSDREFTQAIRPRIQMVFQEPFESLNPRMTVRDSILEPLRLWMPRGSRDIDRMVAAAASDVDLAPRQLDAYPGELTSGQQQRAAIARALAVKPALVVLDEPTSYLDPTDSDQLLQLLARLQAEYGIAYILISHDLTKVRLLGDRVAVMYLGQIIEVGPTESTFHKPEHPYTAALISAVPRPDPRARETLVLLRGEIPSPVELPSGCLFHTRCPFALPRCSAEGQRLVPTTDDRVVACWRVTDANQGDALDVSAAARFVS